jgi:putative Holliday junction resolvase
MSHVLGFDVGTRLIGVGIGNALTGAARPLDIIKVRHGEPDWATLDDLLRQWQPSALVVGLPLTRAGGEQPMTRRARRFAATLGARSGLPAHLHDERHSSQEAARRFAAARAAGTRRRRDAARLDALAAAVIVESWLAGHADGVASC